MAKLKCFEACSFLGLKLRLNVGDTHLSNVLFKFLAMFEGGHLGDGVRVRFD